MRFQRLSKGVEGQFRSPQSGWKVVPQSKIGGREVHIAKLVCVCGTSMYTICQHHDYLF